MCYVTSYDWDYFGKMCYVTKFLEKTYFSSNLPYSKVIRLTIVRNIMVTKKNLATLYRKLLQNTFS